MNLGGICIDQNLKGRDDLLEKVLHFEVEQKRICTFQEALNDWEKEGFVSVCYFENATLILAHTLRSWSVWPVEGLSTLGFVHREANKNYRIEYNFNGGNRLVQWENFGEILEYVGELSDNDVEQVKQWNTSEKTHELIAQFLGTSIEQIPKDTPCVRFKLLYYNTENSMDEDDKMDVQRIILLFELKTFYDDYELAELFLKLVAHLQKEDVNIFIHPREYEGLGANKQVLTNLVTLRDYIKNEENNKVVELLLPALEDIFVFRRIATFGFNNTTQEKKDELLRLTQYLRTPYSQPVINQSSKVQTIKPWWRFW